MRFRYAHLNSASTTAITPDGWSDLWTVNINKVAAGSTITIYDGQDATGTMVAQIDGGTVASKGYGVACKHGITVVIAGGSPDVTIGYY